MEETFAQGHTERVVPRKAESGKIWVAGTPQKVTSEATGQFGTVGWAKGKYPPRTKSLTERFIVWLISQYLPGFHLAKNALEAKAMVEKKNRNLAKVHYEKMYNGNFRIVALEGFLCENDLFFKHGNVVRDRYFSQIHVMVRDYPDQVHFKAIEEISPRDLIVGWEYTKEQFSTLIAEAKLCGSALSRIIKEVKNSTKVIEI